MPSYIINLSEYMKLSQKVVQVNQQPQLKLNILDQLDNLNKKYINNKQEYILLIKKQKDKDYCTLYVSNC